MKNLKKKLRVLLIILIVLGAAVGYDYYRSKQVVLKVSSVTPEIVVASSSSRATIQVTAQYRNGKPVVGHNLYALNYGGGSWDSFYAKTDENGVATFTYFSYDLPEYQKPRDVHIKIRDESNSVFIEMYPTVEYTIKHKRAENQDGNSNNVEDFFN